jgi:hypothetical protein
LSGLGVVRRCCRASRLRLMCNSAHEGVTRPIAKEVVGTLTDLMRTAQTRFTCTRARCSDSPAIPLRSHPLCASCGIPAVGGSLGYTQRRAAALDACSYCAGNLRLRRAPTGSPGEHDRHCGSCNSVDPIAGGRACISHGWGQLSARVLSHPTSIPVSHILGCRADCADRPRRAEFTSADATSPNPCRPDSFRTARFARPRCPLRVTDLSFASVRVAAA